MTSDIPPPGEDPRPEFETPRLGFDDLLEQLIDRAQDVLRTEGRLQGLLRATQTIATSLDLATLLQRIVTEARELIGARYAALGVIGDHGRLVEFVHSGMDAETVARIGTLPSGGGLLGELVTHPHPLRLRSLSDHVNSVGFPPGHPPMHSFLGVPVRIRSHVFGNLYLTEKTGGAGFTAEDEELALSLAAAAASAIDNARLYDAVTRREHWLQASESLTNTLLGVEDRDEALRLLTRSVRAAAGADTAAILSVDGSGEMRFTAADGAGAEALVGALVPADSPVRRAVRDRSPVLLENLGGHGPSDGVIKNPGLGPTVAVPLAAGDQVLGALLVVNEPGRRAFTTQDVQMVQNFAHQAGLVLLVVASRAATKEVELAEERARIARDLHDHAIQGIFAVGLGLDGMAARVGGPDGERMVELVDQLDDAIKAIRRSIFALQRPADSSRAGLRAALITVVEQAAGGLGFGPGLHTEGPVDSLVPAEVADDLVAVLREALSNAARHAGASRVDVRVSVTDVVLLEVRDDGCGIGTPTRSSGLANMATRATRHGGRCEVVDGAEAGTVVRWEVPLVAPSYDLSD